MAKYHYFYQSKANENLDGWVAAKSRDDAYAQLRKVGIKPYKVVGKDPLAWKRWTAIAVLACALLGTVLYIVISPGFQRPGSDSQVFRHQIYGAESVVRNGMSTEWAACGLDEGEKFLARYAQPGLKVAYVRPTAQMVAAVDKSLGSRLAAADLDLIEYRQLKEIVESIKDELRRYKGQGGKTEGFIERLQERQSQEVAYYLAANQELENAKKTMSEDDVYSLWSAKNAELRAIGLPMLKDPGDE